MKRNLTILLLSIASFCMAQDVIYKRDNTKIEGKVLEVSVSEIKYKLASNPDGPIYTIVKSSAVMIIYQNGSHELINISTTTGYTDTTSISSNFCRNFLALDITEFPISSVGIIYEHTFGKKGMFAMRIPFSVGIQPKKYDDYPYSKIFSTGIDFIYFPTGQGRVRYFVAPYLEFGLFHYEYGYSYYYSYRSYIDGQHYAGGIKNGILYQPTKHFGFSTNFGLGIKKDETISRNESIEPHFKANLIIGYRF